MRSPASLPAWLIAVVLCSASANSLPAQPSHAGLMRAAEVGFGATTPQPSVLPPPDGAGVAIGKDGGRAAIPKVETSVASPKADTPIAIASDGAAAEAPTVSRYPRQDPRWQGFYLGGQVGYAWSRATTGITPLPSAAQFMDLAPTSLQPNPSGWTGGLSAGYNWQSGTLVLGMEADFQGMALAGTSTVSPIIGNDGTAFPGPGFLTSRQRTDWMGTLRPRIGAAFDRLLIYGTAGLAYGSVHYAANTDFRPGGTEQYPVSFSSVRVGWTVGVGMEFALSRRWSWKSEYLYYDLGNESATIDANPALPPYQVHYTWETRAHTVNTGLRYRF